MRLEAWDKDAKKPDDFIDLFISAIGEANRVGSFAVRNAPGDLKHTQSSTNQHPCQTNCKSNHQTVAYLLPHSITPATNTQ